MNNSYPCKICDNTINNKPYIVKEMMFGFRDEFDYFECSNCGCLQIKEIPANLEKYYPADYYSYEEASDDLVFKRKLKERYVRLLIRMRLRGNKIMTNFYNPYPWIQKDFIKLKSSILDIGCGAGNLLKFMKRVGFQNLTGADPFISQDIRYDSGITIHKKFTYDIEGKFDFIMLHHSFEHMDAPLLILKKLHSLLNDNGVVLIRVPVANSFSWRKYGVNWVQLDAPRHFFLHTTQSIQLLCEQSDFTLKKVFFDSNKFQFVGSEMYQRNIPLIDKRKFLDKKEKRYFKKEANRLNLIQDGDSACFYLQKQ